MKILMIILLLYGIFEIASNSFHFSKGSRIRIGESAKKQHQELPPDLEPVHYFFKAVIMFIFGLLFTASSLVYFLGDAPTGLKFTFCNAVLHSVYGLVQLILYHRCYKTWGAFVVCSLPLIACFILM